jgi:hypothetical protein
MVSLVSLASGLVPLVLGRVSRRSVEILVTVEGQVVKKQVVAADVVV